MRYLRLIFLFLIIFFLHSNVASQSLDQELLDKYETYKEPSITHRRFNHNDIKPLVLKLKAPFSTQKLGESIEGRGIYMAKAGTGKTSVLLWSQMHGDEATATMALMDIFNFLAEDDEFNPLREKILNNLTLYFIPMLNPDGAEKFRRRNALDVDLNRDALRLQNPESQILKRVRDELDAEWGFNLHDQSRYYGVGLTPHAAAFSFLAPAYNYEKDINEVRGKAMKLIGSMNKVLQNHIPGKIAKYNDDFEPRAFGDNIQKWGTSTILIESGGFKDDWEKQYLRKLHFMLLLEAFSQIADKTYEKEEIASYEAIPFNKSGLIHDLILREVELEENGNWYTVDIGFRRFQVPTGAGGMTFLSNVSDLGDLHNYYAYNEFAGKGYRVTLGKVYPTVIKSMKKLKKLDLWDLFNQGYTDFKLKNMPEFAEVADWPIHISEADANPNNAVKLGRNPIIFLEENEIRKYVVINGKMHGWDKSEKWFRFQMEGK